MPSHDIFIQCLKMMVEDDPTRVVVICVKYTYLHYIHAYILTLHTYIRKYMYLHTRTRTRARAHTHRHTHTHTHTHTHKHTQLDIYDVYWGDATYSYARAREHPANILRASC